LAFLGIELFLDSQT